MAAARFLDAGAGTSLFFLIGQQGGGGQGRSDDAAISGSLASASAPAGPVGRGAEPARLVAFALFLFIGRGGGRWWLRANAPRCRAAWKRRWANRPGRSAAWRRAAVRLAGPARPAA